MLLYSKYQNYIYFEEDEVSGVNWFIANRETKRVVESGHCETYKEAVLSSEHAFIYKERN